ncbi:PAS domain S-box protein [Nocardioides sp. BP30]|uniref:PAS domain S-box protein n=1 Tax=Nocardioides sp. BP30 TaxID=3036374 RepID=UPI002468B14B|nr:PAS domain S-box protein [Nocardioides sp. BP30]WGL52252.1 PAS domain S-box protein [Nocardioides sp. BP30]
MPKPTLVLVDDSDEVRALVRTRLQLSGEFEIVGEGRDGAEAIGLAYRHEPDLLLMDTSMPTMDGLEALPAVLTLAPETKVVIFTGFEERGLADAARDLGAADFIEKSIRIDQLADRLLDALGTRPASDRPSTRNRLRVVGSPEERHEDGIDPAEQKVLDEHLERFREVFERAAIGMATLTLNGSVVRANAALAELMQCQPVDLVGVDYGQLTEGEGDALDAGLEAISLRGESMVTFEHRLPDVAGRTVRVTLAPIRDSKDQPLYVFAQVQDISAQLQAEDDLRRSEELFRMLVTAVRDYAIYMLDPQGNVASWNAGAQRIKGYSADEVIGKNFRIFYPEQERETHHPEQNLAIALHDGAFAEEGWRVRKDGSQFWASVVITAVYGEDGKHLGFAKITRDQTEQRLYEDQHQLAVEQQTHLLAVTAHELRTPTAVIEGSASLLQEQWQRLTDADRVQLLSGISTSAHRLQRLVTDLATASRLQNDALVLRPEGLTLGALLTTSIERTRAANNGAQVQLDLEDDVSFVADAGRLAQAVDNLLDNAIRHGRAPVTATGRATESGVEIRVSDTGPGVPADLVPHLFDRFAVAGRTGGTGLGLFLVREIARGHGGDVTYEPPSEKGPASFVLCLPYEPVEATLRIAAVR